MARAEAECQPHRDKHTLTPRFKETEYVQRDSAEEIKHNRSVLAYDAKPEEVTTAITGKEIFDTNDTIF